MQLQCGKEVAVRTCKRHMIACQRSNTTLLRLPQQHALQSETCPTATRPLPFNLMAYPHTAATQQQLPGVSARSQTPGARAGNVGLEWEGWSAIAGLTQVKRLSVEGLVETSERQLAAGPGPQPVWAVVRTLSGMSQLRRLALQGQGLRDKDVSRCLERLRRLRVIELLDTRITEASLAALCHLPELRRAVVRPGPGLPQLSGERRE